MSTLFGGLDVTLLNAPPRARVCAHARAHTQLCTANRTGNLLHKQGKDAGERDSQQILSMAKTGRDAQKEGDTGTRQTGTQVY